MNELVKQIALDIRQKGGTAYFVGGFVRDKFLGIENKDIDVEIFGVKPNELKEILSKYGEVNEVGSSFGIMMIKGLDIDFAMPRTEKKISNHHNGFEVEINPFMSLEEATKRRDFTINSIMQDIITGEIIDLWGGITDLNSKRIKHIDKNTFVEDPLRVLRACQFASRFNFYIDKETLDLCKTIDIKNLSKERVFEEMKKALIKSEKPSIFFNYLYEMNQLDYFFKEIKDLKSIPQSKIHHPEGDVWNHTLLVLDECSKLKFNSSNPVAFMLSGLCHDLGKINCTKIEESGKITSIGHDVIGVKLANNMLSRLTTEKNLIKYITNMTELHMRPNMLAKNNSSFKASRKMYLKSVNPNDLILLAKADHLGRATDIPYGEYESWLRTRLEDFYSNCKEPLITGKDLIEMGYAPSKEFKDILNKCFNLQISGLSKTEIIKQLQLKQSV